MMETKTNQQENGVTTFESEESTMNNKIYWISDIRKYPNIMKNNPKARFMDCDGNKFVCEKHAVEFYKNTTEYKRRVNKPTIEIRIV